MTFTLTWIYVIYVTHKIYPYHFDLLNRLWPDVVICDNDLNLNNLYSPIEIIRDK